MHQPLLTTVKLIPTYCEIDAESDKLLETVITRLGLSAHDRTYWA